MGILNKKMFFDYINDVVSFQLFGQVDKPTMVFCDHPIFKKYFGMSKISFNSFPKEYEKLTENIPYPDKNFFDQLSKVIDAQRV